MKLRALAAASALALILAGTASAHTASSVTATINCAGQYIVVVTYSDFSDQHRLVTVLDVDGVDTTKTETPTGDGSLTYTGSAKSSISATVTTPDDGEAVLAASAKAPTDCATPTPRHDPTPKATPPATALAKDEVIVPSSADPLDLFLLVIGLTAICCGLQLRGKRR